MSIKRIFRSKRDAENLAVANQELSNKDSGFKYHGLIVNKPWGYEYLMYENEHVAIWLLYLKPNAQTSMHCHPRKRTSLLVLEGNVSTSTLESDFSLTPLQGLIIDSGVFHSTKALSQQGAYVVEIETPPDKTDLVRLKDEYGRKESGYEGLNKMTRDIIGYEYFVFDQDADKTTNQTFCLRNNSFELIHHTSWEELLAYIDKNKSGVICFLNATLIHLESGQETAVGDIVHVSDINLYKLQKPVDIVSALVII